MEIITTKENNTGSKEPTNKPSNEEDLINLVEQYSSLTQPTSDWLGTNVTVVITEASIQGTSTTYHVTVQE